MKSRSASIASQSLGILLASNAVAWLLTGVLIATVANPIVLKPALRTMMRSRLADIRPLLRPSVQVGNWPLIRTLLSAANHSPLAISQVYIVQRETGMVLPDEPVGIGLPPLIQRFLLSPEPGQPSRETAEAQDDEDAAHAFYSEMFFPADQVTGFNPLLVVVTNRRVLLHGLTMAIWLLCAIAMAGTALGGLLQFVLVRRRISAPIANLALALEDDVLAQLPHAMEDWPASVVEVDQIVGAVRSLLHRVEAEQTKRQKLEAVNLVLEREAAIAQTTQMLVHDVRKPFSLMRALLDLLSDVETLDEMKLTLGDVREEVLAATRSVDAMVLDVMEMGSSAKLETRSVEPTELIRSALSHFFRRPAQPYEVSLRYRLHHRRRLQIHEAKVERVLLNLVGNALEAMHGRGELWFETCEVERGGRPFIQLTLGNSNSFIPEESIEKLFDPFFTSGKKDGTGLGLAIVQKVVAAHGGEIRCRSTPETGVEFVFTLPGASEAGTAELVGLPSTAAEMVVTAARSWEREPPVTGSARKGASPTVVLVEDSGAHRAAWQGQISADALRVFETPEALLRAAEAEPRLTTEPRFFVLDQNFPTGSMLGTELADRLRPRTEAHILLCSSQEVADLPVSVDGVLSKQAHDLAELEAVADRTTRGPLALRSSPGSQQDSSGLGHHVVLVEDSRAIQRAWRRRLPAGALRAFDGPAALLAELEKHPSVLTAAHCVVLDNHFGPGEMLGEELALTMRERYLSRTPVILSSDENFGTLPLGFAARISKQALGLEELAEVLMQIEVA